MFGRDASSHGGKRMIVTAVARGTAEDHWEDQAAEMMEGQTY